MATAQPALVTVTPQSVAVVSRYSDGYLHARAIVGIGTAIKIVGIVLAVLTVILTSAIDMRLLIGALPLAVTIGALFFILGILVSSQGELQKATLDAAVYASPFLSDDQRARVMSLPLGAAASSTAASNTCPRCGQSTIEIYERSREGQSWICRSCNHTWQVAA